MATKEIIWALQQIARSDAQGLMDVNTKKEFEHQFLEVLYKLCTSDNLSQVVQERAFSFACSMVLCSTELKQVLASQEFRQEVFVHVEQAFLTGFRSTDPVIREKFFDLYKPLVGSSLYGRLKYILQSQEWEQVASRFWLKQALDFLLTVLCEDEPITLSPNSAHIAPLPSHLWKQVSL